MYFIEKICLKVSVRCALDRGGVKMAKCDICGKGVHFGNNVSHSHRRSNAIWNLMLRALSARLTAELEECMSAPAA